MKTAQRILKSTFLLFLIPLLVLGGFVYLNLSNTPLIPEAKAFAPNFKRSADLRSALSPFNITNDFGVLAMGELGGTTYAVVSGALSGAGPISALLRYEPLSNTWTWVKSVYILIHSFDQGVLFFENRLLLAGQVQCEAANPAAYNYQDFLNRRGAAMRHADFCNLTIRNGTVTFIEQFNIANDDARYAVHMKVFAGMPYLAVSNASLRRFLLLKVAGFNATDNARMRAVRSCRDGDIGDSYHQQCDKPTNYDMWWRGNDYSFGWTVHSTTSDQNVRFRYLIDTADDSVGIVATEKIDGVDRAFVYKVKPDTGWVLGRSVYPLTPNYQADRGNNAWNVGTMWNVNSINVNGIIYYSFLIMEASRFTITIYRGTDITNPQQSFYQHSNGRASVWGASSGNFLYHNGELLHGVFLDDATNTNEARLYVNSSPAFGNTWTFTVPRDQSNIPVNADYLYFSPSANRILAAALPKSLAASSPGIWSHDLFIPTPSPTLIPTQAPPPPACVNMVWVGATDPKNISLSPNQAATLQLTGSNPSGGNPVFQLVDRGNNQILGNLGGTVSLVAPATWRITVNYSDLLASNRDLYRINGIVPGAGTQPNCVANLNFIKPPVVTSASIACVDTKDPYRLRVTVNTTSPQNAIQRNTALLLPRNSGPATIPTTYSGPLPVLTAQTTHANNQPLGYGATLQAQSFTPNVKNAVWSYNVQFDKYLSGPNNYSQFFDTAGGFDLYVYVEDVTGNNANNGQITKLSLAGNVDPFQNCSQLYFTSNGGDLRSSESPFYSGPAQYVKDSIYSNKIWTVNSPTTTFTGYSAKENQNVTMGENLSTFAAELPGANTCTPNLSTTGFCSSLKNQGINQDAVLQSLTDDIKNAVETLKTMTLIDTAKSSTLSKAPEAFYALGSAASGGTVTITTAKIPANLSPLVIKITDYRNVVIDSTADDAAPKNIIFWCSTPSCSMKVTQTTQFTSPKTELNTSATKLTYPQTASVINAAKDKGRLYINFGDSNEPVTVPAMSADGISPLMLNRRSDGVLVSVPAPRRIYLNGAVNGGSTYYLGGFLTSGYVYTDMSSSTNIVKGFIISRGIVARENVTASGNNAAERTKFLYFKDFGRPLLYVDFDAKYLYHYHGLFAKEPEDVPRNYIGL
jgi:hypothetical protein